MTDSQDSLVKAAVAGLAEVGSGQLSLADVLGLERQALELMLDKALGLAKFGKLDDAEAELERLSVVDAHWPLAPLALGAVRAEQRRFEPAVAAYREAEARAARLGAPTIEGKASLCRGHAHVALGDGESARAALRRAIELGEPSIRETAAQLLSVVEGHR